jgi:hypothetical protein
MKIKKFHEETTIRHQLNSGKRAKYTRLETAKINENVAKDFETVPLGMSG